MAPLLRWIPGYSVNNEELDSHHQKMFRILNAVYDNVMNTQELDCVLPIIDELSKLTSSHISAEEQIMRDMGYQEIEAHIATHRDFMRKIDALRTSYQGNNLQVTQELITMLGNWLLRHIINEDWKYSELPTNLNGKTKASYLSS
jgi:hemerythrin